MKLLFGSNNAHKLEEIRQMSGGWPELVTPSQMGISEDPEEPFFTFHENAKAKSDFFSQASRLPCFSEDSGLEVKALNGEPGVLSARYAGAHRSMPDNIRLLLERLEGKEDRSARFISVICLIINGETHYFEGYCEGKIATVPAGEGGFGYDPVFIPEGYNKTFSELGDAVKNMLSHRKKSFDKLFLFLKGLIG
jgi:XTP/dITP diphosphohydrolase